MEEAPAHFNLRWEGSAAMYYAGYPPGGYYATGDSYAGGAAPAAPGQPDPAAAAGTSAWCAAAAAQHRCVGTLFARGSLLLGMHTKWGGD